MSAACDGCLRRTWLVAALAAHIEHARHERSGLRDVLALRDHELIEALGGRRREELHARLAAVDPLALRDSGRRAGLEAICRHDERYPTRLHTGPGQPAVLHVAGAPERLAALAGASGAPNPPAVALVGARAATADGLEIARSLGRGLAAAGVTVVSGMALGIDSAAHEGAAEVGGPTLAVLAGGADVPYPRSKRPLYRRLVEHNCVVSEMPAGFAPFKWCFPARNRTIAGLADATIVVEAAERSGSLITADFAAQLGREVAAVPGRVTSPMSRGTNALIVDGATLVRDASDVLELLFGAGAHGPPRDRTAGLEPRLRELLDAVDCGRDTVAALAASSQQAHDAIVGLTELELLGFLRRLPGGRYGRVLP